MHCGTAIALGLSLMTASMAGCVASGPALPPPAASRRVRLASGRPAPRTLRAARLVLRLLPTRRLHVHCAPPSLLPSTGGGPWPAGSTNLPKSSRRGSGSSRPPKTPPKTPKTLPCLRRRWRLTRDGNTRVTPYRKSQGLDSNTDEYQLAYFCVVCCVLTMCMARQRGARPRRARAWARPEICDALDAPQSTHNEA